LLSFPAGAGGGSICRGGGISRAGGGVGTEGTRSKAAAESVLGGISGRAGASN
jgi:hypothetical protein